MAKSTLKDKGRPNRYGPPGTQPRAAAMPLGFHSVTALSSFAVLCFVLVTAPLYLSGFWPTTYDYIPQSLFSAVTALICLLMGLRPRREGEAAWRTPILWVVSAFFVWQVLSSVTTVYLHDTILELGRVGTCFVCFLIARTLLRDGLRSAGEDADHESKTLNARLGFLFGAIVLGSLLETASPVVQFIGTRVSGQMGSYYNVNLFANFCAISVPICLALAAWAARSGAETDKGRPPLPVIAFSLIVALIVALAAIQTRSKGGFLSALVGLGVFAICLLRAERARVGAFIRARPALVIGVALVLLVGGGGVASKTVLPRLLEARGSDNHSTVFRQYTWGGTLRMAAARPLLGSGPGSFPSAYTQYAETGFTRSAHQVWLQIAAENGFPALILLAVCCILVAAKSWRLLRTHYWPIAAGTLAALAAFIVHGLIDAGWGMTSIALLVFILFATIDALPNSENAATAEIAAGPLPESRLRFEWLGACLAVAGAAYLALQAFSGEDAGDEADRLITQGNRDEAHRKALAATTNFPNSARAWTMMGDILAAGRQNADSAYRQATKVQPTNAQLWLRWARYRASGNTSPKEQFDRAVQLDPHDTDIRWARAEWRLETNDNGGWQDIEEIARLKDEPYGKYPATPEMVDLNYTRAFLKLGERAADKGDKTAARAYAARAETELKTAQQYQKQKEEMAAAMGYPAPESLDPFESQLNQLKERIK